MVARPKRLSKWGTLPGGYTGPPGERVHIGGKPLWLMRALVRDYTKPGDLVCDPMAGAATTLIAALSENRRAIGAEVDPETFAVAQKRMALGYTPSLFGGAP
jgi:DNA modification methylase